MNITKEQADKVIAALEMNRVMAADADGNYTREVTPKIILEALSIMRGLEDAEPLTHEQHIAIREASEIESSNNYFGARPQIDTNDRRKVFEAGFKRGFDAFIYTKEELEAAQVRGKKLASELRLDPPTSPQAAQTEAALCEMVRLSENAGLYDADFKTGRARSKP